MAALPAELESAFKSISLTTTNTNTKTKTGISHDEAQIMKLHSCNEDRHHPESPARISSIMKAFEESGLFPYVTSAWDVEGSTTVNVPLRPATNEEIHANGLGHSLEHLAYVERVCAARTTSRLVAELDSKSLYKNKHSLLAARHSCGACLTMTEAVLDKSSDVINGMVVARPPGHHAEPCGCMGFCFFNNVGVAVLRAKELGTRRILIVDWDVHHGNGTQEMFAEDPNVLFISLHRYDHGTFYPSEEETKVRGSPEYTGRGDGLGATINIAWNTKRLEFTPDVEARSSSSMDGCYLGGIGDGDYMAAMEQIIVPAAREVICFCCFCCFFVFLKILILWIINLTYIILY